MSSEPQFRERPLVGIWNAEEPGDEFGATPVIVLNGASQGQHAVFMHIIQPYRTRWRAIYWHFEPQEMRDVKRRSRYRSPDAGQIPSRRTMRRTVALGLIFASMAVAQEYTRGVGIYPGDPKENFAPALRA